tara:strand:+ start:443 stop:886 length:444 start_codon:yes stop_codon:yes gene_type:complete
MKNKEQLESAGLAIIYNNKLLLGHQRGRRLNEGYGIPKGLIDKGESILQAAIRETKEEFGITIPQELIDTSEFFTFKVNTHKYNKTVYCHKVMIDSLNQIGLEKEYIPVSNLQLDEVDDAYFMDKNEASNKITKSQRELCNHLIKNL